MLENVRIREAWLRLFVPVAFYVKFNKIVLRVLPGLRFVFGTDVM